MTNQQPIKVMIVDDHPIVCDGLKNMLLAFDDLMLAGEANDGSQVLTCYEQNQPDVILMDIYMPGIDGITAARIILGKYPQVKIIMLTSSAEDGMVQSALDMGAVGFLLKNIDIDMMATAIRSANAGQPVLSPEVTSVLIRTKASYRRAGTDLSERELEVLALIVQGLSNDEIAEQLGISPATAKNHVSACLHKLGATNRAQAAVLATKNHLVS